jgi:hypothetical protein
MLNRGTMGRRAAWVASWILGAGLLHPAWATSVQTYWKNEYVVVANGIAPDQRYAEWEARALSRVPLSQNHHETATPCPRQAFCQIGSAHGWRQRETDKE